MKKKFIEVRRGNVTVKICRTKAVKNGQVYTGYAVSDYSKGKRKLWPFADEKLARAKAEEIAAALAEGKTDVLQWEDGLRAEIRKALQAVEPTGGHSTSRSTAASGPLAAGPKRGRRR